MLNKQNAPSPWRSARTTRIVRPLLSSTIPSSNIDNSESLCICLVKVTRRPSFGRSGPNLSESHSELGIPHIHWETFTAGGERPDVNARQ